MESKMFASNLLSLSTALLLAVLVLSLIAPQCNSLELTIELRDREKQCFHEEISIGTKASLVYQVIHGGELDVDMILYSPSKTILYQDNKRRWDAYEWNTTETGQYTFCFGNEFSISSHKLLYFEFIVGHEDVELPVAEEETGEHKAAMDLMKFQMTAQTIHENLESISEAQTGYRLNEAMQRRRAEDLKTRVTWWSAGETIAVVLVSFVQVWAIKSFFSRHTAHHVTFS